MKYAKGEIIVIFSHDTTGEKIMEILGSVGARIKKWLYATDVLAEVEEGKELSSSTNIKKFKEVLGAGPRYTELT